MKLSYALWSIIVYFSFLLGCSQNRFGDEPKLLKNGLNTDPGDVDIDTDGDIHAESDTNNRGSTDSEIDLDTDTVTSTGMDWPIDAGIDSDRTIDGGTRGDTESATDPDAGSPEDTDSNILIDTETNPTSDTDTTSATDTEMDTGDGSEDLGRHLGITACDH